MALSLNEAKQILEPYIPKIHKCVDSAVRDYLKNPDRIMFSKRTRANIINDLMVHYAGKHLLGTGVMWRCKRNSFYFIIEDRLKLKFKMFDSNLKTRNIPTRQALNFVNQQGQLEFLDTPLPLTNIFAGYKWNCLQTAHDGIYITCPKGENNSWVLELTPGEVKSPVIIPFNTPTERKRVIPRKVDDNVRNINKDE